jgi:hypothetical protein
VRMAVTQCSRVVETGSVKRDRGPGNRSGAPYSTRKVLAAS